MMHEMSDEELREAKEHRDALMAIRAMLTTSHGQFFFKYIFKSFEVNELPEVGLEGILLADKLGFLRAGNSIFKLVAEADARIAGNLLAQLEEERYAQIYNAANIGAPIEKRED